ncbi:hypothetical protein MMC13_005867 [Lambiella insularis]|nr:hypothetical protein [Lambiella insularis]
MTEVMHSMSPSPLLELLSNTLILYQICPHLPISALMNLAATSKSFQHLIYDTPNVFQYLDLSTIKGAAVDFGPIDPGGEIWRSERMDEAITEDEFYGGPLRGVFSALKKKGVLQDVQTLILDGLSVPADLISELVTDPELNIHILSIREAKNLNEGKLKQFLKHICRLNRPDGLPKLKGLYLFVPRSKGGRGPSSTKEISRVSPALSRGITNSIGAQLGMQWNQRSQHALSSALDSNYDPWYQPTIGLTTFAEHLSGWADVLSVCRGIIAFDAVLCRGPRHNINTTMTTGAFLGPMTATVALGPNGCQLCHSAPEGPAILGRAPPDQLPLLDPPPLHSSKISVAQTLPSATHISSDLRLFLRCRLCLIDRWCEGCNKFFCENCYQTWETSTYTQLQKAEMAENGSGPGLRMGIKVHLGLCIEDCLVGEMYNGAGSGGMWG